MTDVSDLENDDWLSFRKDIEILRKMLRSTNAALVNKTSIRDFARTLSENYLRKLRPKLVALGLDVTGIDDSMQRLRLLSERRSSKSSYYRVIKDLCRSHGDTSLERDLRLGGSAQQVQQSILASQEVLIVRELENVNTTFGQSYRQVLRDLQDEQRLSYRGTACELREILRAALDHLAPDEKVMSSDGFQLEKDRKGPTMKQKVRYVLRARRSSSAVVETAGNSIDSIEEKFGGLVRSAYERGSSTTHGSANKTEIKRFKSLIDVLLCELFDIED